MSSGLMLPATPSTSMHMGYCKSKRRLGGGLCCSIHEYFGPGLPFYSCCLAKWKPLILQPDFKKSNWRFHGLETISSAGVATDKSGNERQVKSCKMSGEVTHGLQPGGDLAHIDDAWLAYSFQANFMYMSVF